MTKDLQPHYTLERIVLEKALVRSRIEQQSRRIKVTAEELAAPFKPVASKSSTALRTFNSGMAIFDGLVLGFKIFRKLRRVLH